MTCAHAMMRRLPSYFSDGQTLRIRYLQTSANLPLVR